MENEATMGASELRERLAYARESRDREIRRLRNLLASERDVIERLREEVKFLRRKDGLALRELDRANKAEAENKRLLEHNKLHHADIERLRAELREAQESDVCCCALEGK